MTNESVKSKPARRLPSLVIANRCRFPGVAILDAEKRISRYDEDSHGSDIGHCLGMTKRGVIAFSVRTLPSHVVGAAISDAGTPPALRKDDKKSEAFVGLGFLLQKSVISQ